MLHFLVFLGGTIAGLIASKLISRSKKPDGHFKVVPFDEDDTGFYKVNISIKPDMDLLSKSQLILKRDNSQD